jgi:hypothetical protein
VSSRSSRPESSSPSGRRSIVDDISREPFYGHDSEPRRWLHQRQESSVVLQVKLPTDNDDLHTRVTSRLPVHLFDTFKKLRIAPRGEADRIELIDHQHRWTSARDRSQDCRWGVRQTKLSSGVTRKHDRIEHIHAKGEKRDVPTPEVFENLQCNAAFTYAGLAS